MKPLQNAIEEEDFNSVKESMSSGIDINQPLPSNQAPLVFAINRILEQFKSSKKISNDIKKIVILLLQSKADPNIKISSDNTRSNYNNSFLIEELCECCYSHLAFRYLYSTYSREEKVEEGQNDREDIKIENINTIYEVIEAFIAHGANIETTSYPGSTLLLNTLTYRAEGLATILLDHRANIHAITQRGETTLILACQQGFKSIVERLLEASININLQNFDGLNALDYCTKHLDLALILLERGIKTSKIDLIEWLVIAEEKQYIPLINYLLKKGVAKSSRQDHSGALHYVKSAPLALSLLEMNADINAIQKPYGITPLLHACIEGDSSLIRLLIKNNANMNSVSASGDTALHYLSNSLGEFNKTIFEELIAAGASINQQNNKGETVLHLACSRLQVDAILLLLDHNCKVDLCDKNGLVAIEEITDVTRYYLNDSSFLRDNQEKIRAILNKLWGCLPKGKIPKNYQSLIHYAHALQDNELTNNILDSLNLKDIPKDEIDKLIRDAALFNNLLVLEWLVDHEIFLEDHNGDQLLYNAVNQLRPELVKFLIDHGIAPIKVSTQSKRSTFSVLLSQAEYAKTPAEHERVVAILELIANYFFSNSDDSTFKTRWLNQALQEHIPYSRVTWMIIQHLLKVANSLPSRRLQKNIIFTAIHYHNKDILLQLLQTNDPDNNHENLRFAATIAIEKSDFDILEFLLDHGLDPNEIFPEQDHPEKSRSLLHLLLLENTSKDANLNKKHELFIIKLIKAGAHVQGPSKFILPCFYIAIANDWIDLARLLLEGNYGYSSNLPIRSSYNNRPCMPLEIAVKNGSLAAVQLLLENKADVTITTSRETTLLHLACEKGSLPIIKCLVSAGINIHVQAKSTSIFFKETHPLTTLFDTSHPATIINPIIQYLLEQGIKIDLIVLIIAIGDKRVSQETLEKIIESCSLQDLIQIKALHIAVSRNNLTSVQVLINKHGQHLVNLRDPQGRTPLHLATRHKDKNLLAKLKNAGADVSLRDYNELDVEHHALYNDTIDALEFKLPSEMNLEQFKKLRTILISQAEFKKLYDGDNLAAIFTVSQCSDKLIKLFGNADSAIDFINSHADKSSSQPIHDICLFNLPLDSSWHTAEWAQLAMRHGQSVTKYLHFAARIEALLGLPPKDLAELENIAKEVKYAREHEHPALAKLFSRHQITESGFNRVLSFYKIKNHDLLPPLEIKGTGLVATGKQKQEELDRYYLSKLRYDDPLGFILGALTHCCQSVGQPGEPCAVHGMTSPYGGFYVIKEMPNQIKVEKLITLLEKTEKLSHFAQFLALFPKAQKETREKYAAWRKELPENLTEDEVLEKLKEKIRNELEEANQEVIVAQSWAWLSKQNSLVFDSWERRHAGDNWLCLPFISAAAQQAISKHGIQKVLLGKGGNTPDELKLESSNPSEIPMDYADYRDSSTQLVIATRESLFLKEKPKDEEKSSSPHTFFSAQSKEIFYDINDQFFKLIQFWINLNSNLGHREILLLPTLHENNITTAPTIDQINNPLTCIQLIFKKTGGWACLIFDVAFLENKKMKSNPIYLDASAEDPSPAIDNHLKNIFNYNYFTHDISCNKIIFHAAPKESAPWLAEILKVFVNENQLILLPIRNINHILTSHQLDLERAYSIENIAYERTAKEI